MGMSLPQDPAFPILGIYPKEARSHNKDICSMMFIAALFVIARNWKQPRCFSAKEWIEKMEYYSAEKKQWNLEICRKMDESRRNLSERGNPIAKRRTGKYSHISGFKTQSKEYQPTIRTANETNNHGGP